MKIIEAYLRFNQLVNGNITSNNISVDKPRFVLLYNAAQTRYLENMLDKRNDDGIRAVSELLVVDKKLEKVGEAITHSLFSLPKNYFDHGGAWAEAISNGCSDKMKLYEVKSEDIEEKFNDWSHEPSFKYRETFYLTSGGNFIVYKKDFKVEKVYLTYYRKPKDVDIEGYIDFDGTASKNIDPELSERVVEKIIRIMAKENSINSGNPQQAQLDTARLTTPT